MKNYKILILVVILCFYSNCKNNYQEKSFLLEIDAVIKESDSIQIYYSKGNSIDFQEKQSFWIKVKGSEKNQKIEIVFPDTIKPKQIRLDFGRNIKQPEIIVNELRFSYKNRSFSAKGEDVYYLFRVDESNTIINKLTGSLNRKGINQIIGPSLYPNGDKLNKKLNQLYTEKSTK